MTKSTPAATGWANDASPQIRHAEARRCGSTARHRPREARRNRAGERKGGRQRGREEQRHGGHGAAACIVAASHKTRARATVSAYCPGGGEDQTRRREELDRWTDALTDRCIRGELDSPIFSTCFSIRGSIVVSIPARHAGDPGSIPGRGAGSSRWRLGSVWRQTGCLWLKR